MKCIAMFKANLIVLFLKEDTLHSVLIITNSSALVLEKALYELPFTSVANLREESGEHSPLVGKNFKS